MSGNGNPKRVPGDISWGQVLASDQDDQDFCDPVMSIQHDKLMSYSDSTKAMFSEFVKMYREIQNMGIDPEWLVEIWGQEGL